MYNIGEYKIKWKKLVVKTVIKSINKDNFNSGNITNTIGVF